MRLSLPGLTIETSWRGLRYWVIHLFVDELIFSADGKLFYVGMTRDLRPRDWCSVEKDGDGKYVLWPFSMYEIKSGTRQYVSRKHPLVKLYRSIYADEKSGR